VVVVPGLVVVAAVVVVVGLVGLSPLQAELNAAPATPRRPSASRRLSVLDIVKAEVRATDSSSEAFKMSRPAERGKTT
jgi:hypothetical protein